MKIFFAVLAFSILLGLYTKEKRTTLFLHQNNSAQKHLHQLMAVEEQITGNKLPDITLQGRSGPVSLNSILEDELISVVVAYSLKQCSSCREAVLENWYQMQEAYPDLKVIFVISEDAASKARPIRFTMAEISATPNPSYHFIDQAGDLSAQLEIDLSDSPLIMLVNHAGGILNACKPSEITMDRAKEKFGRFVKLAIGNDS
jgi:hypothetical protein